MPAARKYKRRISFTLNTEADILDEFAAQCKKEGSSISERFTKFMTEELEKNAIGSEKNPIAVSFWRSCDYKNTLDDYLDKNFVTVKQFMDEFQNDDFKKLERKEALGLTIAKAAKQISHVKQTGKYLA